MVEPSDEIVDVTFNGIVKMQNIINHPTYLKLMEDLDFAALAVFNFLDGMGFGNVNAITSKAFCPKGHLHDLFEYTDLREPEEKDH